MTKLLFIQGRENYTLRKQTIDAIESATGLSLVHLPCHYTLRDPEAMKAFVRDIDVLIESLGGDVIILAHSFGGILAYALSDTSYTNIRGLITLGTPHTLPHPLLGKLKKELGYRDTLSLPYQHSCGFLFDTLVPFFFTRYPRGTHSLHIGTHTRVPDIRAFYKRIVQICLDATL